jgi:hypothetical protein
MREGAGGLYRRALLLGRCWPARFSALTLDAHAAVSAPWRICSRMIG